MVYVRVSVRSQRVTFARGLFDQCHGARELWAFAIEVLAENKERGRDRLLLAWVVAKDIENL